MRRDWTRRGLVAAGAAAALGGGMLARPAPTQPAAPPLVVEKRVFEAGSYRTRGGDTIANVRIGYQTAGRLNAAGDNAVLISHFFSGNSHAFGRLGGGDGPPGWWDAIIGPGKAIDTERWFVVAADNLVNVNAADPNTTTTGPATTDPATGRPYGLSFPVVSLRDFVEVHRRLVDHLGIRRLALVAGPSNGGLNTIEWAAAYPEMVERAMPVIAGELDAWLQGWLDIWAAPIRLDPNWRNGDYYGREPPLRGLAEAWKIVTLQAQDRAWTRQFNRRVAQGQDPARRLGDRFEIERVLDAAGAARARATDANSFLYMVRANQLFLNEYPSLEAAVSRSRARWLVVPAATDWIFPPGAVDELVEALRRHGRPVEVAPLGGDRGHLDGLFGIAQAAERIRAFLAA
ncbi:E22 family MetX-like putative esterase [Caldovatus aquaticus]|uniref:Probable acyltransferase n=1 Tax=Caldovatus aquaticus TaxID=2865671 RepID=A0ABS7F394_9PROT|nr:homoserine O-acetyltransferase [Caldovatus aquaticus]MBW8270069.1 homoserine O-acetyltransferase [Caldovatus aquaticus]